MFVFLEYLVSIGGSIVLFLIAKATNLGVRNFTLYLLILIGWSIVMYLALHLIHRAKHRKH